MRLPYREIVIAFLVFLAGPCLVSGQTAQPSPSKDPSFEDQQTLSTELFNQIYEVSMENRAGNIEKIISLYDEIIAKCPEAPLAQESYFRLVEINLRDFKPPAKEKAFSLYAAFNKKYPESPLKNAIQITLARFLYLNHMWKELLVFIEPDAKSQFEAKKIETPLPIFLYAEAKFHLKDFPMADKGYQLIIKHFPETSSAKQAKARIKEMGKE